ncbi:MAG TPA: hypothetical protein VNJ12_09165 [Candidatus Dormibacteraeota bacterium]|nr:hypothetical protein [Candidatus Dormibacteraeota bacterium]
MRRAAIFGLAVLLATAAGWAQQTGPMQAPLNPPVIKRIPLFPKLPPPPMSPDQIIQHFIAHETEYRAAYQTYGFRQTIRVEELGADGNPTGNFQVEAEVYPRPGGKRFDRIVNEGKSSLQVLSLAPPDLETIAAIPAFPLAGDAYANYKFTYRGTDKQGELMTYVFEVQPKILQPGRFYFSGIVWVDTVDLAIVKSYGRFLTNGPKPSDALPFTYSFLDIYRENVAGKYWFPSYVRSEDYDRQGKNELPIRLIVRSSNFRPGGPMLPPAKPQ